jgi:hypothetical protein
MRKFLGFVALCSLGFCAFQIPMGSTWQGSGGGGASIVQPTSSNPLAAACGQYGSTNTCAYPVNVTSGNEGFVLLSSTATGTFTAPSKSAGTATIGTVTAVGSGCDATGATCGGAQQWYQFSITGSGSLTISAGFSVSTNLSVLVFEVSSYHSVDTTPVYHSLTSSFCSSACALASITPGTTGDLIMAGMANAATGDTYTTSPYTLSGTGPGTVSSDTMWITMNYTAPSTSTINPTFTPSGALGGQSPLDSAMAVK